MRVGIDLMGSETSPDIFYKAVLQAAEQLDASLTLSILATPETAAALHDLKHPIIHSSSHARIEFIIMPEVIFMADAPLAAIRKKKNSTLMAGIRMLKKHQISALVTAGNTGALIAGSTLSLSMLPGINRPALATWIPTETGPAILLDVGGYVSCKAKHLVQYAFLGAAYQKTVKNRTCPTVGLLNIGIESKKGTTELKSAYQMFEDILRRHSFEGGSPPPFRFIGNVEGRDVFKGKADIIVTDAYAGNILLKSSEGISSYIFSGIEKAIGDSPCASLKEAISELKKQFNYAEYPGAVLCGIEGVVIKCHGHSSLKAILNGILGALQLAKMDFVTAMKREIVQSLEVSDVE